MKILRRAAAVILAAVLACICPVVSAEQAETGLEQFIVRHGSPDSPKVAITMDDCNNLEIVWKTVELCRKYGIGMTFFPNGKNLHPEDREKWQDLLNAGCEIGSHAEDHMAMKYPERVAPELMVFQQHLDETLGYHYETRWFRPPYGQLGEEEGTISLVMYRIKQCGYDHALLWNVSYMWDSQTTFGMTRNGSILLFHAVDADYQDIEGLIPLLLEAGFEPVTVSEMFGFDLPETSDEIYVFDSRNFTYPRPDP